MAKQENVYWPSNEETNIQPVEIVDEIKQSMLQYSMSVLVGRALPDVRDGLKPVHRRILYTMYENSLTPDKAYRKCADTVGSVLGMANGIKSISEYWTKPINDTLHTSIFGVNTVKISERVKLTMMHIAKE